MKGIPKSMQDDIYYQNTVQEITYFFSKQIKKASSAGINDIIIDPGFGFGKSKKNNFTLLQNLSYFENLKCPILIGISRKSMVYKTLGIGPDQSLNGTTALNAWGLDRGAKILRVHDVKEAKECIDLWLELQ
jgi:dihydropteroate synthase